MSGAPVKHLAIIPDGNRRWARERGLTVQDGHRAGIRAIDDAIRVAFDHGVEVVTFWWGSPANLTQRAPDEVRGIVEALEGWLTSQAGTLLHDTGARFEAHGRIEELCPQLLPAIREATAQSGAGPRRVVLLMGYDGRDELRAAATALAEGRCASLEDGLWTGGLPDVDLLLRSGGSLHLSAGFMLWRIAEARLAFVDELWPAVTRELMEQQLDLASGQARRYGR